jgi:hypothetical protein
MFTECFCDACTSRRGIALAFGPVTFLQVNGFSTLSH